jgi:hypothetical protein
MWLMTKYGFYSIVQKQPDEYHIRGRERKDIENLVAGVPLPAAEIKESSVTDYAVRIIVGQTDVLAVLEFLGKNLDYNNFKDKIDRTQDQARKPYHEVWRVLAKALGAYGSKPGRF